MFTLLSSPLQNEPSFVQLSQINAHFGAVLTSPYLNNKYYYQSQKKTYLRLTQMASVPMAEMVAP